MNKEFLDLAFTLANKAKEIGEVPVGAVVIKDGVVLGTGYNQKESLNDPTAHAEILAIKEASKKLNSWHLDGCEIYITLEPCSMCAGAILSARIKRVYFAAFDKKYGASEILDKNNLNHTCEVYGGIEEEKAKEILNGFFKDKR